MKILLTNDDGIFAPGIRALREEFAGDDDIEIFIVAPDRERSATGHAITVHHPLRVEDVNFPETNCQAWMIDGTPADCIKIALEALLPAKPDLIISGINRGPNLGTDVFYSGTVSAAFEGSFYNIQSIAVSYATYENNNYKPAARFAHGLISQIDNLNIEPSVILNINVPLSLDDSIIPSTSITKLGVRKYQNIFEKRFDPRGKMYFWLGGEVIDLENSADSDIHAIKNNQISITPIHFDITSHNTFEKLKALDI